MNKIIKLIPIILMLTILNESLLKAQSATSFQWQQLSSIPDQIGFAGSYAGVAGNVLIFAGGANFPDGGAPWTGSKKAWTAQLFVLDQPNGAWKVAGNLPQKMGYGISINYKDAMILIGGSNEQGHLKSVYKFTYNDAKLKFEMLPDLPKPIANTCGVLVGDVIYVMGGITDPDAKTAENNFWALDLSQEKKAWHILPTWPGAARMLSVAGALNDELYLFSGVALIEGQRKYLNDAYKFTSKNVWEKIADLPHSVAAAPTPAFASKKEIMVFGGDDGSLASTSATLKEKHPGFSKQILAYVSGLGPQLAQNIVDYRNLHGAFKNRESLKKVARLGEKAYEQAAGFLRIRNAEHPLDTSAVHPERYALVEKMAKDLNCTLSDLMKDDKLRKQIDLKKYVSEEVGLPTLQDILAELAKPGRDPREQYEAFAFADGINKIEDLKVGMELPGIITNITNFGAFVDVGVHQDGLVHLSQMADKFIANPNEVVKVSQRVKVKVVEVDAARKRISLSMKLGDKPRVEKKKEPIIVNEKPKQQTFNNQKPIFKKKEEPKAVEGDMQDKLKALMGKFK